MITLFLSQGDFCATANVAFWSFFILALLLGSEIFDRIVLIACAVFLAGRATVGMLLHPDMNSHRGTLFPVNSNYLSIAVGPAIILVLSCLLRAIHFYTFPVMVASVVIFICIAAWRNREFRSFIMTPGISLDLHSLAYIVCILVLWIRLYPHEYPFLHSSAVYLTQGFDLYFDKDSSEWPYFGEKFVMPTMYATHTIGSNIALFSNGDHFEYYQYGLYWLNILLTPIVPIGAYLFFKRFLPWWTAIITAALFCWSVLDWKIWSIRGETLGWIFGFAFLLALTDLLSMVKARNFTSPYLRLAVVLPLLYFALALTHGVVAMIVSFFSVGLVLPVVIQTQKTLRVYGSIFKVGIVILFSVSLLSMAYAYSFPWEFEFRKDVSKDGQAPWPGERDAALLFESAINYPDKIEIPAVVSSPPLIKTTTAAQMTAFLPPASVFRDKFADIPVKAFPAMAINNLGTLALWEKLTYLLLLCGSCTLFSTRFARLHGENSYYLFWGAVAVYSFLIAVAVYFNFTSVSTFPLAATRRTYVYARYFYWLAIYLTLSFLMRYLLRFLITSTKNTRLSSFTRPALYLEGAIFTFILTYGIAALISHWTVSETNLSLLLERIRERTVSKLSYLVKKSVLSSMNEENTSPSGNETLFEAIGYVRDHTAPGDWIFSNIISDNQFWYLSSGRYSLLEGSAMYQVYSLQRRAAERIERFTKFAMSADPRFLADYDIQYVLLYKRCRCELISCFGFNVLPASEQVFISSLNYEKVFENTDFVIFHRTYSGQVSASSAAQALFKADCYDDPEPRYSVALAEGVTFHKSGYPDFIARVKGLSIRERWGRWSNGDYIEIKFRKPLPRGFELIVKADAFGPNIGKPIPVHVGNVQKSFVITESGNTYHLMFNQSADADTITFKIPCPTRPVDLDPSNKDDRRMGIGLNFLKIK